MAIPRLHELKNVIEESAHKAAKAQTPYQKIRLLIEGLGDDELYEQIITPFVKGKEVFYPLNDDRVRALSFLSELTQSDLDSIDGADIIEKAQRQKEKDTLSKRTDRIENLSFGFEIEMVAKNMERLAKAEWLEATQALSALGIPIGPDGDSEIELPYSLTPNEQLRAVLILIKLGIIRLKDKLTLHLNVGGFETNLHHCFEEILLVQVIMEVGNFFGRKRAPGIIKQTSEKRVSLNRTTNLRGLPFVIKNDHLLEWRGFPFTGNFIDIVKGTLTLNSLMESAASYMKMLDGLPLTQQQEELSQYWVDFISEIQVIFERHNFPHAMEMLKIFSQYAQADMEYEALLTNAPSGPLWSYMEKLKVRFRELATLTTPRSGQLPPFTMEQEFNILRSELNRASHDNPTFRSEVRNATIRLRHKVRSLAQE